MSMLFVCVAHRDAHRNSTSAPQNMKKNWLRGYCGEDCPFQLQEKAAKSYENDKDKGDHTHTRTRLRNTAQEWWLSETHTHTHTRTRTHTIEAKRTGVTNRAQHWLLTHTHTHTHTHIRKNFWQEKMRCSKGARNMRSILGTGFLNAADLPTQDFAPERKNRSCHIAVQLKIGLKWASKARKEKLWCKAAGIPKTMD